MDCFDLDDIRRNVRGFCSFLWNSERKEFLGRKGRSWFEITIFFIIFYGILSGFFITTIIGFYKTIDEKQPSLLGDSSLLKGNPGLGYRPMPDRKTTLIRVSRDAKELETYKNNTNDLLKKYENETASNAVDCSDINETRPEAKVPCRYNFSALTENCHENNSYGMADGQPCVLLKLNKVYGWTPNPWKIENVQEVSYMSNRVKDIYTPDQIWVDCHGESGATCPYRKAPAAKFRVMCDLCMSDKVVCDLYMSYRNPADKDNIGGEIEYYPRQGFPVAFYPYLNQKDYRSPLVFVKFLNVTRHVGIMVECVALDRNIKVDKREKEGSVHFELIVDV